MLTSRNDDKHEGRFAARIDVLTERVDMLASTIATTASAIAKKDGEIAALQRAFESRDETLRALVQHVNRAAEPSAADVPVDANELRSLRNAVAALTKERAGGVTAAHIEAVDSNIRALAQRVEALAAEIAAPPAPTTDPATTARIDTLAAEVASVQAGLDRPPAELVSMLSALGERVDGLAARSQRIDRLAETLEALERKSAVGEEQLDRRLETTDDALATLSQRIDTLSERLETARAAQEEQLDRRFGTTRDALTNLSDRLDALPEVDEEQLERRLGETDAALAALAHRLGTVGDTLGRLERTQALEEERLDRRFATTNDSLTTLSQRLDALPSVDEAQLERRLGETDRALERLSQRLDRLGETVESAASLGDKERELATLHRDFRESSTRIESIVDDIRQALHAFPVQSSTSLDELATRLEHIETATRKATESSARIAGELSGRIDVIDQRVATVAEEVSRAKTLWPVALRSLEARLDDAVGRRTEPGDALVPDAHAVDEPADDLLAGVRDSLQAMESVAAEMARASETLGEPDEELAVDPHTPTPTAQPQQAEEAPAAAASATIVPLRAGEP